MCSQGFNKALPGRLIEEERTRQLLEIEATDRDYMVALSEENLQSSQLWEFVEEKQGIPIIPIDFVLPLLYLRHAIHVVFGGNDLQSF